MGKTNKNGHKPVIDPKNAGFPSTNERKPSGKDRAVVKPNANSDNNKKK